MVEYITELQQLLQSLEAKKQRAAYRDVLSPRPVSSPRPSPFSPRPPPPSPRISPRTPQPGSPYKPILAPFYLSPAISPSVVEPLVIPDGAIDLSAKSRTPVANVEVKYLGPNVLLKTISPRLPGQALKIVSALDRLALEILQVDITTVDDTVLNSFTIQVYISLTRTKYIFCCGLSGFVYCSFV